jgi:hypothetical protein
MNLKVTIPLVILGTMLFSFIPNKPVSAVFPQIVEDGGEFCFPSWMRKDKTKNYSYFGFWFGMTKAEYFAYEKEFLEKVTSYQTDLESCNVSDGRSQHIHFVASVSDKDIVTIDVWMDPTFSDDSVGYLIEHSLIFEQPVYGQYSEEPVREFCQTYLGKETETPLDSERGKAYFFKNAELIILKKGVSRYGAGCSRKFGNITMKAPKELKEKLGLE